MKALVLAAGRGSRLGDGTSGLNKCMLPLCGAPLVQYSLENAVHAAVSEIVVVVGYRAQDVINAFGIDFRGTRIQYVIQENPSGLVHAIETARPAIGDDDFMLLLADEILWRPHHQEMVKVFYEHSLFAVCGVVREQRREEIRKTYALIEDPVSHRIHRLIEKPRRPASDIRGTGNCIFRSGIFDYVGLTPINQSRGEKELPDLVQCAIDDGEDVRSFDIGEGYVNVNTPEDIAIAEREWAQHLRLASPGSGRG
jgi:dTDP-glucose pyrophosphorylase